MPPPPPASLKPRKVAKKFPAHLKEAANPLDTFSTLAELEQELPGAASTGYCEQGLEVTLGAGFDFGPLLTFGAPVVTAEVGAEVGGTSTDCLLLALVHQPSVVGDSVVDRPLMLAQLSGARLAVTAKLTATVGVGVETTMFSEYNKTLATVGAARTAAAAKLRVVQEPTSDAPADPTTDTDEQPDVEDVEAETPDESDIAVGLVATAMASAEASVAYSYMLLREPNPQRYASASDKDLVELLSVTLSGDTKEQHKARAVALLAGATVDLSKDKKTVDLLANLEKLKPQFERDPALERKREACINALTSAQANKKRLETAEEAGPFLDRFADLTGLEDLRSDDGLKHDVAPKLVRVIQLLRGGGLFPTNEVEQLAERLLELETQYTPSWEKSTLGVLGISGIKSATPKSKLFGGYEHNELVRCLKKVIEVARQVPKLLTQATAIQDALDARPNPAEVANAKKQASAFIQKYGAGANFDPGRPWFGGRIPAAKLTAQLQAAVDSRALSAKEEAEAKALIADLRRVSRYEQRKVKEAAIAYLAGKPQHSRLPSFGTPSRTLLIECLSPYGTQDPKAVQLSEALDELNQTEEDTALTEDEKKYAHLTYLCARSPRVTAGGEIRARVGVGVTAAGESLSAGASAQAGARIEASRARTRLQTFFPYKPNQQPVVQTQDVKVTTWSAAAEVGVSANAGERSAAAGTIAEFGGLQWQAATLRWTYPKRPDQAKAVKSLPGSGLSFGRSVKRERFLKKVEAITSKTSVTPYMRRLAKALRVNVETVRAFLADTFGRKDFRDGLTFGDETEVLLIEATFALTPGAPFGVGGATLENLKKLFRSGIPVAAPKLDVEDTRAPMKKLLGVTGAFTLQSISVRYRVGEETDRSRVLFELSHSYVVVATANVTRVQKANTNGLVEVLTWWPDEERRRIDEGLDEAARKALRSNSVPPTILVSL